MDLESLIEKLSAKLATLEESNRAGLEVRRHTILQELASIERQLDITPTTAQIREWYRQVNRP